MNQLVSILTLTYNHEKFIIDCINSVQAQTYKNWEMLIVDDGSTDNTVSIAQLLAKDDFRIKVFARENIGVFRMNENYNFALSHSKGKYIAILDGDDVWLPEKLATQIPFLENDKNAVLAWSKAYNVSSDLKEVLETVPSKKLESQVLENNPVGSILKTLVFLNFIPALSIVFRRSVLEKIGGFQQESNFPTSDCPTLCCLANEGPFIFIDVPLGKWRWNLAQTTKQHVADISHGHYNLALKIYNKNEDFFKKNTNIKISDIKKYYYKALTISYSRAGRFKLINKNYNGAIKDYLKSIFRFGLYKPIWKMRSFIGLFFSIFHLNLEEFVKKIGRFSYK